MLIYINIYIYIFTWDDFTYVTQKRELLEAGPEKHSSFPPPRGSAAHRCRRCLSQSQKNRRDTSLSPGHQAMLDRQMGIMMFHVGSPLVNIYRYGKTPCYHWGNSLNFDWAIFNSCVKLPEGIMYWCLPTWLGHRRGKCFLIFYTWRIWNAHESRKNLFKLPCDNTRTIIKLRVNFLNIKIIFTYIEYTVYW